MIEQLKIIHEDIELYQAGLPHFPRNFSRDSIISGIVMGDMEMLKNQLRFAAKRQGKQKNALTGEEYGKIFHEYPGFSMNDRSTEYNACDTTALFLLGHQHYQKITGDNSLKEQQKENIIQAVAYITSHLIDNIFYENPLLSDAERFALKVTYWKDSEIIKREKGMPHYPVAYFLAHVINLAGMRAAAALLDSSEIQNYAESMKEKIHDFFNKEKKEFYIAIDSQGPIEGISSDVIHALFYLDINDLTDEELTAIERAAQELETSIGYLTLSPRLQKELQDDYHAITVWPFEQAIIHMGAKKFGLSNIAETSARIATVLDTNPEIFIVANNEIKKSGCDPQLWTIAAKQYFLKLYTDGKT